MTGATSLTRLRPWNALAVALLVAYAAGIVLFCSAALMARPTTVGYAPTPPFSAYGDPGAWWPVALQVGLGLAAFGAYYLPRRHEPRSFSLLATGGLGVSTLVLGLFGVWHCAAGETPFFAPLAMALALLLGDAPTFTGLCANRPLLPAVQVARLFGPLLLVITALGIAATLFRAQLDRLVVRFLARSLVVVVGLSDEALPLVRRLAGDLPRRTVLTVLVAAESPLVRLTRQLGARVVVCDPDDARALRSLVRRKRRFPVQALYLVSADVSANLAWARQFRDLADDDRPTPTEPPPRITARIDDPWQAEYWRRTNAYRTPTGDRARSLRWVSDALSVHEVTAALLVGHVQSAPHDRLALVGRSPLALAICAELAQRQREGTVLGRQPKPSFAELVLVGPGAAELRAQHEIRQERFGNAAGAAAVAVAPVEVTEAGLAALLEGDSAPAVLFADDRPGPLGADLSPTLLAARHPDWTIYAFDSATEGLVPRPIMERLYPFGPTLEPPEGAAVDSWERAARVVHQGYLDSLGDRRDPARPAHRQWADLPPFYRASNVRLVTATLAGAESVGRTWGPIPADRTDAATTAVPPDQLAEMARLEHDSWRWFYREQGWSYGDRRDDARRVHDALRPWEQLSADYRDRALRNVRDALTTLHALGYRSWTTRGDRTWEPVTRHGEVHVTVLESDWHWQNGSGEWLQGRAGDYQVRDGDGRAWSVDREIFARSYEHLAGNRWRRTGTVFAQPAVPGELVVTLEGPGTAEEGDWVIRGAAGEQWLISAEHFAANYERAGGRVPSGPVSSRSTRAAG
jgi:hypothetical protein